MNKVIAEMILKKLNSKKTNLLLSSLSYYSILAIIPTLLVVTSLLKFLGLEIYLEYQDFFDLISLNMLSNTIISLVTLYMISRIFFVMLKDRFSLLKSLAFSIVFSLLLIIFLSSFLSTYLLQNNVLSIAIKVVLVFTFFFLLLYFISESNAKYSLIFSLVFSLVSNIFIYFFIIVTSFFINYENYYGILAPIFLIILAMNIFIYIARLAYISAEEFTKISRIKIIKC